MTSGFAAPRRAGFREPARDAGGGLRTDAHDARHVRGGTPCVVERVLTERLGVDCCALQVAPGAPSARATVLTDGRVSLFELGFSVTTEFFGRWRDNTYVLLTAPGGWKGAQFDSRVLQDDEVLLLAPASECWRLQPAGVRVAGVSIAPESVAALLPEAMTHLRRPVHDTVRTLRMPRVFLEDFFGAVIPALDRVAADDSDSMASAEWDALRLRGITALRDVLRQDEPRHPVGRPAASYRRLIIRTREMIQRGEHVSPTVTDLCESLHVSPRTLQYAFQKSLGISVAAYVRSVRLDRVRRTLSDPAREVPRISDVATRWGFWHPSQFSRLYFRQFGELPSETLAQTRRRDSSPAVPTAQ